MSGVKLPVVIVEWLDAVDWESPIALAEVGTRHRPEKVLSIGWLLKDDADGVTIGCEYYDEMFRRTEFIPRVNIKAVTPYHLAKPRAKKSPINASEEQQQGTYMPPQPQLLR